MFFEGAEKKVEIVVSKEFWPLTKIPREQWVEVVELCGASILSEIKNEDIHAFLLSESSLFIWEDRILMLTCGDTLLYKSVLHFIEKFGQKNIDSLIFQRKNEYRARLQHSSFLEDIQKISEHIDGQALRFGKMHGHYNLLFHLNRKYEVKGEDYTSEFLMYDISKIASDFLTRENLKKEEIRNFFKLDTLLENFDIDDHVFNPYGYSLNAIKDHYYYTIHITPQNTSPYVSFETNLPLGKRPEKVFLHLLEIFKPGSFDFVTFNTYEKFDFGAGYIKTTHTKEKLKCGYDVDFSYYHRENVGPEKPLIFDYKKA